jgi:hypothetical protein
LPDERLRSLTGALPFVGSIARERLPQALRQDLRSRRAHWVALAWALATLESGGRAALIAPLALLHGSAKSELEARRQLVCETRLHAIVSLPPGLVKARTHAAIVAFERGGSTQSVWMHEIDSATALDELLARWPASEEDFVPPPAIGRIVTRAAIEAAQFDLRPERHPAPAPEPPSPHAILHEIATLEADILQGIRNLVGMLK